MHRNSRLNTCLHLFVEDHRCEQEFLHERQRVPATSNSVCRILTFKWYQYLQYQFLSRQCSFYICDEIALKLIFGLLFYCRRFCCRPTSDIHFVYHGVIWQTAVMWYFVVKLNSLFNDTCYISTHLSFFTWHCKRDRTANCVEHVQYIGTHTLV